MLLKAALEGLVPIRVSREPDCRIGVIDISPFVSDIFSDASLWGCVLAIGFEHDRRQAIGERPDIVEARVLAMRRRDRDRRRWASPLQHMSGRRGALLLPTSLRT